MQKWDNSCSTYLNYLTFLNNYCNQYLAICYGKMIQIAHKIIWFYQHVELVGEREIVFASSILENYGDLLLSR